MSREQEEGRGEGFQPRIQWGFLGTHHHPHHLLLDRLQWPARLTLPVQGLVYTITGDAGAAWWMCTHFEGHPLFGVCLWRSW